MIYATVLDILSDLFCGKIGTVMVWQEYFADPKRHAHNTYRHLRNKWLILRCKKQKSIRGCDVISTSFRSRSAQPRQPSDVPSPPRIRQVSFGVLLRSPLRGSLAHSTYVPGCSIGAGAPERDRMSYPMTWGSPHNTSRYQPQKTIIGADAPERDPEPVLLFTAEI